ncbi:MAG TPA: YfiR/HmsC family protein, partial [Salinivirgaceae bacterium]|nr:YfiR/HmsC family protein [Salinivirgaceae bacterium]
MCPSKTSHKVSSIAILLGLLLGINFRTALSQNLEEEVRSAMILNFIKHTQFPNQNRIKVYRIAFLDDNIELFNQLKILSETATINGIPFEVLLSSPSLGSVDVDVIYVGSSFRKNIPEVYQKIKSSPVLLITDDAPNLLFTMINLRFDVSGKKLIFDINPHNFDEANLSYSPELIRYGGSIIDLKQSYYQTYKQLQQGSELILKYQHELDSLSHDRDSFLREINRISGNLEIYQVNVNRSKLALDSLHHLIGVKDHLSESLSVEMEKTQSISNRMKLQLDQQVTNIQQNGKKLSLLDSQLNLRNKELFEKHAVLDSLSKVFLQKENEIKSMGNVIEKQRRMIRWVAVLASLMVVALIWGGVAFLQRKNLSLKLEGLVNIRTQELERTTLFFRNLFEKSPVATYQLDLTLIYDELRQQWEQFGKIEVSSDVISQMVVLDVNQSTLDLFGFESKSDFITNFPQTFSHLSFESVQQSFVALLSNQTEISLRAIRRKKNGELITVIVKLLVITSTEDSKKIVLVTIQDITELTKYQKHLEELIQERAEEIIALNKNLIATNEKLRNQKKELEQVLEKLQVTQNQLIQQEKMASLGMLSAGIAHEINNPINFISGSYQALQILIEELEQQINQCLNLSTQVEKDDSDLSTIDFKSNLQIIKEMIGNIEAGVDRVTSIIRSLSAYSHSENNKLELIDVEKC